MVKVGLPEKVTWGHRLKKRGNEPAEKVGGERWWTEGQSIHAGDAVWGKTQSHGSHLREPFDIYSEGNMEHCRFMSRREMTRHLFIKDHYGGPIENKL